jgi:hypothetical protein
MLKYLDRAMNYVDWLAWRIKLNIKTRIDNAKYLGWFPYVTTYRTWQNYGGPEEGGWWYDAGCPIETRRVFQPFAGLYREWRYSKLEQESAEYHLPIECDINHPLRADGGEPMYYGDTLRINIHPDPPEEYPKERPHYE